MTDKHRENIMTFKDMDEALDRMERSLQQFRQDIAIVKKLLGVPDDVEESKDQEAPGQTGISHPGD